MEKNKRLYIIGLALIFVLFSIIPASQFLYNWDAGQFALGIENYSISEHQPHPPGYPIFIAIGKILNIYIGDANSSLTIISIIFGWFAVLFLFLLTIELYPLKKYNLALITSLFLVFNPVFWFYREIALTYTVDAFMGVFVVYCFYKGLKNKSFIYLSSIILGLAGGFRPTLVVLLFPLFCLNYIYLKNQKVKTIFISLSLILLSVLIWLIPMLYLSGGVAYYLNTSQNLYSAAAASTSNKTEQIKTFLAILIVAINTILIPLVITAILFIKKKQFKKIFTTPLFWISVLWILPATTVYTFMHFGQPGYVLVLIPVFIVIAIPGINYFLSKKQNVIFLLALLMIQAYCFMGLTNKVNNPVTYNEVSVIEKRLGKINPWIFKFNYFMINKNDKKIQSLIANIKIQDSQDTILISSRNLMFKAENGLLVRNDENFRQIMFYLPEYQIFEVAPDRDFYITGNNFSTTNKFKSQIKIPDQTKQVIFIAQQIDEADQPENLILKQSENFYMADLQNIDSFEFLDFTFSK